MAKRKNNGTECTADCEIYVYIGPTVRGMAISGSIVIGTPDGAKERFAGLIEKYPEAVKLIVRDEELADAKKKLKDGSNALSIAYKKISGQV